MCFVKGNRFIHTHVSIPLFWSTNTRDRSNLMTPNLNMTETSAEIIVKVYELLMLWQGYRQEAAEGDNCPLPPRDSGSFLSYHVFMILSLSYRLFLRHRYLQTDYLCLLHKCLSEIEREPHRCVVGVANHLKSGTVYLSFLLEKKEVTWKIKFN